MEITTFWIISLILSFIVMAIATVSTVAEDTKYNSRAIKTVTIFSIVSAIPFLNILCLCFFIWYWYIRKDY